MNIIVHVLSYSKQIEYDVKFSNSFRIVFFDDYFKNRAHSYDAQHVATIGLREMKGSAS